LVIGAGAVGTEVVKNLAMLGVREIDLVDFDKVSKSNLNRCVFFHPSQSDRVYKVDAIKEEVNAKWPDTILRTHAMSIQEAPEEIWNTSLVIVAVDNNKARHYINLRTLTSDKTQFVINGAMGRTFIEVQVLLPKTTSCLVCSWSKEYTESFFQNVVKESCDNFFKKSVEKFPSISILNSIIGGIISSEAVKILVGIDRWQGDGIWEIDHIPALGEIIRYDIKTHDFSVGKIIRNPRCIEVFCRQLYSNS
jgi:adenylyltransferase/sulfurtransferase